MYANVDVLGLSVNLQMVLDKNDENKVSQAEEEVSRNVEQLRSNAEEV